MSHNPLPKLQRSGVADPLVLGPSKTSEDSFAVLSCDDAASLSLLLCTRHVIHPCDCNCHDVQARSFKPKREAGFLPKPSSDEKAYTSEALTSSLDLYKQKFADAAAGGNADDVFTSMEQASVCTVGSHAGVLQVHLWTEAVHQTPLVCGSMTPVLIVSR